MGRKGPDISGFVSVRFRKVVSCSLLFFFLITSVFGSLPAGAVVSGINLLAPIRTSFTPEKLNVDTFTLPQHLGQVKAKFKANSDKTIIHIQDAHCNQFAQYKISGIIDYLYREYGIKIINLEGASGNYDLRTFTSISGEIIRREVAKHFVESGEINGAEYFAINNPRDVELWGIEDKELYLSNLKVYRDSLQFREDADKCLNFLTHVLNNLKRHIYSSELVEIDRAFNQYKSGEMEIREYMEFLLRKAREEEVPVSDFKNLFLLDQAMVLEEKVDFKKANNERDLLVSELKRNMSIKDMGELASKSLDFRTKRITTNTYYDYLLKEAEKLGIRFNKYAQLKEYIGYVSTYENVDQYKVTGELDDLCARLKEQLFNNDTQRRMDKLSRNLAITKNIISFKLTKSDYEYYLSEVDSFAVANYTSFIKKEAPKYKVSSIPDGDIALLDQYREDVAKFYKLSFDRDEAFVRNVRYGSTENGENSTAIIMTGGFHTKNLCDLLEKEGVSYVTVMPKFVSEDNYDNQYFELLGGGSDNVQASLKPFMSDTSAIAIADKLSPGISEEVWGKAGLNSFMGAVFIREQILRGRRVEIEIPGEETLVFNRNGKVVIRKTVSELVEEVKHNELIDPLLEKAFNDHLAGKKGPGGEALVAPLAQNLRDKGAERIRGLAKGYEAQVGSDPVKVKKLNDLADQIQNGEVEINLVNVGDAFFDGHAGGRGIHINMKNAGKDTKIIDIIVHEGIAGIGGDHELALAAEGGKADEFNELLKSETLQLLADADADAKRGFMWNATETERRMAARDMNAIRDMQKHLQNISGNTKQLHQTLKLLAAGIAENADEGAKILIQGGLVSPEIQSSTLRRLNEFDLKTATEAIVIANDAANGNSNYVKQRDEDYIETTYGVISGQLAGIIGDKSVEPTEKGDKQQKKKRDISKKRRSRGLTRGMILNQVEMLGEHRAKVEANDFPDIINFGDKHGMKEDLERILAAARAAADNGKELVINGHGDVFDRGKDNFRNFEILKELKDIADNNPNVQVNLCLGNHDVWLIQAILLNDEKALKNWIRNGGMPVIENFKANNADIKDLAEWLLGNMKLFHIDKRGMLHLHAGIPADDKGNPLISIDEMNDLQAQLEYVQKRMKHDPKFLMDHENIEKINKFFKDKKVQKLLWVLEEKWIFKFMNDSDKQIQIDDANKQKLFTVLRKRLLDNGFPDSDIDLIIENEWEEFLIEGGEALKKNIGIDFKINEQAVRRARRREWPDQIDKAKLDNFLAQLGVAGIAFGHVHAKEMRDLDGRIFCVDLDDVNALEGDPGHMKIDNDGVKFDAMGSGLKLKLSKSEMLANLDAEIIRLKSLLGEDTSSDEALLEGHSSRIEEDSTVTSKRIIANQKEKSFAKGNMREYGQGLKISWDDEGFELKARVSTQRKGALRIQDIKIRGKYIKGIAYRNEEGELYPGDSTLLGENEKLIVGVDQVNGNYIFVTSRFVFDVAELDGGEFALIERERGAKRPDIKINRTISNNSDAVVVETMEGATSRTNIEPFMNEDVSLDEVLKMLKKLKRMETATETPSPEQDAGKTSGEQTKLGTLIDAVPADRDINICFACTANFNRSPAMEISSNHLAAEKGINGANFSSFGAMIAADENFAQSWEGRTNEELIAAARALGIPEEHLGVRSKGDGGRDTADIIIVAGEGHRRLLMQLMGPDAANAKVILFGDLLDELDAEERELIERYLRGKSKFFNAGFDLESIRDELPDPQARKRDPSAINDEESLLLIHTILDRALMPMLAERGKSLARSAPQQETPDLAGAGEAAPVAAAAEGASRSVLIGEKLAEHIEGLFETEGRGAANPNRTLKLVAAFIDGNADVLKQRGPIDESTKENILAALRRGEIDITHGVNLIREVNAELNHQNDARPGDKDHNQLQETYQPIWENLSRQIDSFEAVSSQETPEIDAEVEAAAEIESAEEQSQRVLSGLRLAEHIEGLFESEGPTAANPNRILKLVAAFIDGNADVLKQRGPIDESTKENILAALRRGEIDITHGVNLIRGVNAELNHQNDARPGDKDYNQLQETYQPIWENLSRQIDRLSESSPQVTSEDPSFLWETNNGLRGYWDYLSGNQNELDRHLKVMTTIAMGNNSERELTGEEILAALAFFVQFDRGINNADDLNALLEEVRKLDAKIDANVMASGMSDPGRYITLGHAFSRHKKVLGKLLKKGLRPIARPEMPGSHQSLAEVIAEEKERRESVAQQDAALSVSWEALNINVMGVSVAPGTVDRLGARVKRDEPLPEVFHGTTMNGLAGMRNTGKRLVSLEEAIEEGYPIMSGEFASGLALQSGRFVSVTGQFGRAVHYTNSADNLSVAYVESQLREARASNEGWAPKKVRQFEHLLRIIKGMSPAERQEMNENNEIPIVFGLKRSVVSRKMNRLDPSMEEHVQGSISIEDVTDVYVNSPVHVEKAKQVLRELGAEHVSVRVFEEGQIVENIRRKFAELLLLEKVSSKEEFEKAEKAVANIDNDFIFDIVGRVVRGDNVDMKEEMEKLFNAETTAAETKTTRVVHLSKYAGLKGLMRLGLYQGLDRAKLMREGLSTPTYGDNSMIEVLFDAPETHVVQDRMLYGDGGPIALSKRISPEEEAAAREALGEVAFNKLVSGDADKGIGHLPKESIDIEGTIRLNLDRASAYRQALNPDIFKVMCRDMAGTSSENRNKVREALGRIIADEALDDEQRLLAKKARASIHVEKEESPFGLADGDALAVLTRFGIEIRADIPMSAELLNWNINHEVWHHKLNNDSQYADLSSEEKEVIAIVMGFQGMKTVSDAHLKVLLGCFGITSDNTFAIQDLAFIDGIIGFLGDTRPGYSEALKKGATDNIQGVLSLLLDGKDTAAIDIAEKEAQEESASAGISAPPGWDTAEDREKAIGDSFSSLKRRGDIVKTLVPISSFDDAPELNAPMEKQIRELNRSLAKKGFGIVRETRTSKKGDRRQVVTCSLHVENAEATLDDLLKALEETNALLQKQLKDAPEGTKGHIVVFAPNMAKGPKIVEKVRAAVRSNIDADVNGYDAVTVIKDGLTDSAPKENKFIDVAVRVALARHISYYYNGEDSDGAMDDIKSLLSRVSDNPEIAAMNDIEQLLDMTLEIKPVVFKNLEQFIASKKAMDISL